MAELYEDIYKRSGQFSFGKNWRNFLNKISEKNLIEAERSMVSFVDDKDFFRNKTFIDIGCGSSIFSLEALRLGATRVLSIDIDDASLECAHYVKEHFTDNNPNWTIKKVSALNPNELLALGKFDIVFSWGVLHHTGDMWPAIKNCAALVSDAGYFYLAIYNDRTDQPINSTEWVALKQRYNQAGYIGKKRLEIWYMLKDFYNTCWPANAKSWMQFSVLRGLANVRDYPKNNRGMLWYTNMVDWLGGYPYEYSSVERMEEFFKTLNFKLIHSTDFGTSGIACNEFLFQRIDSNAR